MIKFKAGGARLLTVAKYPVFVLAQGFSAAIGITGLYGFRLDDFRQDLFNGLRDIEQPAVLSRVAVECHRERQAPVIQPAEHGYGGRSQCGGEQHVVPEP